MSKRQYDVKGKRYEIMVKGHLDQNWSDWFTSISIRHEKDGTTTIIAEDLDQAALHGLLKRVRDLGLPLLAVNQVDSKPEIEPTNE